MKKPVSEPTKTIRIGLECTNKCLVCNVDPSTPDLCTGKHEIIKTIVNKSNCDHIVFSGGEPTLNKDLVEYCALARSVGYKDICIQTNLVLLSDLKLLQRLQKAGVTHFLGALYACSEKLYDKITRTVGLYPRALQALRNLTEHDIPFVITYVLHKLTYVHIPEYIRFFIRNKFTPDHILLVFVAPNGNWPKTKEIIPAISEVTPFIRKGFAIAQKAGLMLRLPELCGIPICTIYDLREYVNIGAFPKENIPRNRTKPPQCKKCIYSAICTGFWTEYFKLYGYQEITPIVSN
jgi:MoaA/NifB/PqqE/SkfB family radical SAM enzyme